MSEVVLGDFDLNVKEVVLVHRCTFNSNLNSSDYRNGRGISGLVYCIEGKGIYDFGDEKLPLEPGSMIFLPSTTAYEVSAEKGEKFKHITANFSAESTKNTENTVFSQIMEGKQHYLSSKSSSAVYKALLDKLVNVWQTKKYGYNVIAKSLIYELLFLYLSEAGEKTFTTNDYKRLLPAKTYLDENFKENTAISELAKMCSLSETHFRRLFSGIFGCSPVSYRLNKRILLAKDLLVSGEYTVADVALSVGFEDANYFSRIFKIKTGINPKGISQII